MAAQPASAARSTAPEMPPPLLVARPEIALDRFGGADPLAALWLLWSMLAGLASGTGWAPRPGALRQLLSSEACLLTLVLAFLRLATH